MSAKRHSSFVGFLYISASLTECQSGSSYATLRITVKAFKALVQKFDMVVDAKDSTLEPFAQNMRTKLEKYDCVICGEL